MPDTMTIKETMKAARIHAFGGPEALRWEETATPEPRPNEILVHVRAAGVNPVDWKIREGILGEMPLPATMGIDFSGTVEAVGDNVANFSVGQEVFGQVSDDSGSFAEFAVAPETQVAHKPDGIDYVQAAALPVASLVAWQALFDAGHLEAGQKILIHAAAGGVGSFAVQFAKWKGAHVVGTASPESMELVRQLGADEVINYRSTRFDQVVSEMDVVFDTLGGDTQERSLGVLKRNGILVSIVQPPDQKKADQRNVQAIFVRQKPRGDQLARIASLVAVGTIKVNVETLFPLDEARAALERSQGGHVHGKIVLMNQS